MFSNSTGSFNVGVGGYSLLGSTTGRGNTGVGTLSLSQVYNGSFNTALGFQADVISGSLSNATAIGYNAIVNASNTIQLGNSDVTHIYAGTGTNAKVIAGGLQITGGTLAAGKVLTSDNLGNATWQLPSGGTGSGWSLTGNAGTVDGVNFIGTTDNVPLNFRVNNINAGKIDPTFYNSFYGLLSGASNTTGYFNSALGYGSLNANTTGFYNNAFGVRVLVKNETGNFNAAFGSESLGNNISGNENTALGTYSLITNLNGHRNTAVGFNALEYNITGDNNTSIGWYASTGNTSLNNSTAIGSGSLANISNKIRLGDANVTVIEGAPMMYTSSDGRFKYNLSEDDVKGLEFIKKLRPVVYNFDTRRFTEFLTQEMPDSIRERYLSEDFERSTSIRQSGFIAQEVERAAAEVGYNFNGVHVPENRGDNYSLAYAEFVVPLVKAVQELSGQNTALKQAKEEQAIINESLKKDIAELKEMISAQKNNNIEGSIKITEASTEAKLFQNAPNPFSKTTTIKYSLPASAKRAAISITNMDGVKIKTFVLNSKNGEALNINGGELSAGTYVYTLMVNDVLIDSKKMILTR